MKDSDDKTSRINLSPEFWGPNLWKVIHSIAIGYPKNPTPKIKKETKKFIESLEYILPCHICREHIAKNLVEIPPKLNSRDEFILWTYKIHNKVNNLLNKEECNINKFCRDYSIKFNGNSFEPFGNTTSEFHTPRDKKNSYFYLMIFIGILVIGGILAGFFYKSSFKNSKNRYKKKKR